MPSGGEAANDTEQYRSAGPLPVVVVVSHIASWPLLTGTDKELTPAPQAVTAKVSRIRSEARQTAARRTASEAAATMEMIRALRFRSPIIVENPTANGQTA